MNHSLKQTIELMSQISGELRRLSNLDPDELVNPHYSSENKYKAHLAKSILNRIQDTYDLWQTINAGVKTEGTLERNHFGRYELDGYELTSGHPIEIWDEFEGFFIPTRVEHSGADYYVIAWGPNISIDGEKARIKNQ